ncbi:hypothetical protein MesoLjLb_49650 [Mesorhizobium sp. L-8-3]|nr:hypothetical protein MesoLjLb_49650 [Mesorhizobium sp. L-8-3]
MGLFVLRTADFLNALAIVASAFIALGIATTIFMYIAAATTEPLADPLLASIDASLGFNWLWLLSVTNRPIIAPTLAFAYHALSYQLPLVLLVHMASRRTDRAMEFVALLAVSSAFTGTLMALVPAEGAYAFFRPADFSHFTAQAGMWHHETLMALRSGRPFDLIMTKSSGLVTFPSYHTALGIMVVFAFRHHRWLFWPAVVLNTLMIMATLPEGGHHLIDVVAGAAVGFVSVALVQRLGDLSTGPAASLRLVSSSETPVSQVPRRGTSFL